MSGRRGRNKKRATGRFYALIGIVAICAVLIVVFTINNRRNADRLASNEPNPQATEGAGEWGNEEIESISDLMPNNDELEPLTDENRIVVDKSDLSINPNLDPVWKNILLLGTDTRNIEKNTRTDTMMILSINTQDGRVKLMSLMRDMYVEVTTNKDGDKRWEKINAAAYYGGPYAAIKTVNECFSLNISEYIRVNFIGMQDAIDILGGVNLDITEKERVEINSTIKEQAKMIMTKEEWDPEKYGLATAGENVHLTGMQAVGYARIRNIGDGDFDRTRRQRLLLEALFEQAKGESLQHLMQLARSLMTCIDTNIDMVQLIDYGTTALKGGAGKFEVGGNIPLKDTYINTIRKIGSKDVSALYDVQLEPNAQKIYSFIYNE